MAAIARELHAQQENGTSSNAPVQARGAAPQPKPLEGTAEQFMTHPAFQASGQFGPLFEVTKIPTDAD